MSKIPIDPVSDVPSFAYGVGQSKQGDLKSVSLSSIATADDNYNVAEPSTPTHPLYPYNKAEQTISGHLFEVDDTPGAERLLRMHKSGTMEEIHPDGKRVLKVFGDDFYIILDDHNLVVGGNLNITVQGNANLLVKGNMKQKIDGDYNLTVNGNMTTRVGGSNTIYSKGAMQIESGSSLFLKCTSVFRVAASSIQMKCSGIFNARAGSNMYMDAGRVDINLPGPMVSDIPSKDPTAGLTVPNSLTDPPLNNLKIIRADNKELLDLLDETSTLPKDRTHK